MGGRGTWLASRLVQRKGCNEVNILELRINNPKKDRDFSNTGRVPVSGYSLCRCEGIFSDLMAGKADCLKTA